MKHCVDTIAAAGFRVEPPADKPIGARRIAVALGVGLGRLVLDSVRHKVAQAVERRRMNGIRRNPMALTAALTSAKSLLIVCHGNIIRSAFARCLVAQSLDAGTRISVSSAGLEAVPGRPPHPTAVLAATRMGVDLACHTSAPVDRESVTNADVIFVMEVAHLVAMRRRFPETRGKTFLLTCLAPETALEIRDPVEGDESVFQASFDHIARVVGPIVRILSDAPQGQ